MLGREASEPEAIESLSLISRSSSKAGASRASQVPVEELEAAGTEASVWVARDYRLRSLERYDLVACNDVALGGIQSAANCESRSESQVELLSAFLTSWLLCPYQGQWAIQVLW